MRGEGRKRILRRETLIGRLLVAAALLALAACLAWGISLAGKESCETCHTDQVALRASLSPLAERSGEEEES